MKRVIHKRPQAILDLAAQTEFIARDSLVAAERLLAAADEAFSQLCSFPELGEAVVSDDIRLRDLRFRSIRGFRSHLVIYRPIADGIEIVRVLHAARDWMSVLENP